MLCTIFDLHPKTLRIDPRRLFSVSLGCAPGYTGLRGWKRVYLSGDDALIMSIIEIMMIMF